MPPKVAAKGKAPTLYKQGTAIKDLIPGTVKNPAREGKVVQIPQNIVPNSQKQQVQYITYPDPEEWPGEEAAKAFDFGLSSGKVFQDPTFHKIENLPGDYVKGNDVLFWRRASQFVRGEEAVGLDQSSLSLRVRHFRNRGSLEDVKQEVSDVYDGSIDDMGYNSPIAKKYRDAVENPPGPNDEDQQPDKSFSLIPTVFISYERDETPQQFELRKKQIEAQIAEEQNKKAAKKPGKGKEEVIPDVPVKIKDVRLSNIDMSIKYPSDCKWIASNLQMIKDRNINDVHTNKPIWTKIYPQQDGIPILNPSGRYWVKLYYFGKERKVEVDDTVPLTVRGNSRFPKSVHRNEIWTQILTKALLKMHFHIEGNLNLMGTGYVMYALTGLANQRISLKNQDLNWKLFKEALGDENFKQGNIHMACFATSDHQISAPSNKLKSGQEAAIDMLTNERSNQQLPEEVEEKYLPHHNLQEEKKGDMTMGNKSGAGVQRKVKRAPTITGTSLSENYESNPAVRSQIHQVQIETKTEKPTYIIREFAYPIIDSFFNETFNMVYVQKRGERELKLRQQLFDLSKTTMHQMNKEEKLEFRKKQKQLREQINDEDRQRVDLITKAPVQYQFLRLRSLVENTPLLNIVNPFLSEEILLAKKCVINQLSQPPNYQLPEIRDDGQSVISATVKAGHDEQFIVKELTDFSSMPYAVDPMSRGRGGVWVQESDFLGCFNQLLVFYNPRRLRNFQFIEVPSTPETEVILNEENEVLIIQKTEESEENQLKSIRLLFSFDHQTPQNQPFLRDPFAILERFDFSTFTSLYSNPTLSRKTLSSFYQSGLDNKHHVFKLTTFSPVNFFMQIACDNSIRALSVMKYLTEVEGYTMKNFTLEHPALENGKFHAFFRLRFNPTAQTQQIFVRVKSSNDNYNLTFFRFKLFEVPHDFNDMMFQSIEGVHKNLYETTTPYANYVRFVLQEDTKYFLTLEGIPQYAVGEGALEIEVYFKHSELQIDNIQQVDPVEYIDKYTPYQYGIVFRERLFVNQETLASFHLRIANIQGALPPAIVDPQAKAPPQKPAENVDLVETPLQEQRLVKLELYQENTLIQYAYGINSALLSNIIIFSTQNEAKNYYLQASFDLLEWPECQFSSPETDQIHWILRVSAADNIAIIRDTQKDDLIKSIKKSWEDQEPGRLDKAKKARKKYMALLKKQNGGALTEEEALLLSEPRLSKQQREEEAAAATLQKGGKGGAKPPPPKKDDKKAGKGGKQQEVVEEKKEIRPLPKSEDHNLNDVTQFLQHLQQDRYLEQFAPHSGMINVRSEENLQEMLQGFQMGNEDLTGLISRNIFIREQLQLYQKDLQMTRLNELQMLRTDWKESWDDYLKEREKIQQKLTVKIQKEKEILQLCKAEQPNVSIENLQKMLLDNSSNPEFNLELLDIAHKVLQNMKINALSDQINAALENFQVNALQACIEDFQKFQVTGIDNAIIEKAGAMLEEAADNPNYQTEKLAQAKKAGQKPGKK